MFSDIYNTEGNLENFARIMHLGAAINAVTCCKGRGLGQSHRLPHLLCRQWPLRLPNIAAGRTLRMGINRISVDAWLGGGQGSAWDFPWLSTNVETLWGLIQYNLN